MDGEKEIGIEGGTERGMGGKEKEKLSINNSKDNSVGKFQRRIYNLKRRGYSLSWQ